MIIIHNVRCAGLHRGLRAGAWALIAGMLTTVATSWVLGTLTFGLAADPPIAVLTDAGRLPDFSVLSPRSPCPPSWAHVVQERSFGTLVSFVRRPGTTSGWFEHHYGGLMVPFSPTSDSELVFDRLVSQIPRRVLQSLASVDDLHQYARYEFGWPFLALACERAGDYSGDGWDLKFNRSSWAWGIPLPSPTWKSAVIGDEPILALQPQWPGFLQNAGFWTSVWLLLILVPSHSRRLVRAYRGRCLLCGYSLVGNTSGRCPECGAPGVTGDQIASGTARADARRRIRWSCGAIGMVALSAICAWMAWPPPRPTGTLDGAIERNSYEEVRSHLFWGADANGQAGRLWPPLVAVFYNHGGRDAPEIVELLLSYHANVRYADEDGETPLHLAALFNRPKSLAVLLRYGASVDARRKNGVTPLLAKAGSIGGNADEIDVVTQLLAAGADIEARDSEDLTPLLRAMAYGDVGLIRFFLDRGANANARRRDGATAIHLVVKGKRRSATERAELLELLLTHDAAINAVDSGGDTPLHFAVRAASDDWVGDLLKRGADPNAGDNIGETPLFVSVSSLPLSVERHQALIDAGADIRVVSNSGDNLMHAAVETWWDYAPAYENIRFLIRQGVDVNGRNHRGATPLRVANERAYRDDSNPILLKRLLVESGATE